MSDAERLRPLPSRHTGGSLAKGWRYSALLEKVTGDQGNYLMHQFLKAEQFASSNEKGIGDSLPVNPLESIGIPFLKFMN